MQDIKIFNSQTKQKQTLKTVKPGVIQMYVCGMTVDGYCHIGHGRVMAFFDTAQSIFKHFGYEVNYVRNITDIDDKIIAKALSSNTHWQDVTTKFINNLHTDTTLLNLEKPTIEPKATENIQPIITMIQTLLEKNHAYIAKDNDIYFSVKSFENYGNLSNQKLDQVTSNIRKTLSESKQNKLDFILWKQAKPNEPSWDSPWGKGRPGWHIECSAMANRFIGKTIDIHGGGIDLKFPHHENEIAQSEAANNTKFVNCWMHVGHITTDSVKMSKSLNNFTTIKNVYEKFHPEVIRYFLLTTHYRSPLNFSQDNMQQAKKSLLTLYATIDNISINDSTTALADFETALADDFNLPKAFAICFKAAKSTNQNLQIQLKKSLNILKLGLSSSKSIIEHNKTKLAKSEILSLIEQRSIAKNNKNWELADQIRSQLLNQNIAIEDGKTTTTWKYK